MRWPPWRRRDHDERPAGDGTPEPVIVPAWATLPPLQRTTGPMPDTFKRAGAVRGDLVAPRSTRLTGPLGHHLSAAGPSGYLLDLAIAVPVQRVGGDLDALVLARRPRRPDAAAAEWPEPAELPVRRLEAAPVMADGAVGSEEGVEGSHPGPGPTAALPLRTAPAPAEAEPRRLPTVARSAGQDGPDAAEEPGVASVAPDVEAADGTPVAPIPDPVTGRSPADPIAPVSPEPLQPPGGTAPARDPVGPPIQRLSLRRVLTGQRSQEATPLARREPVEPPPAPPVKASAGPAAGGEAPVATETPGAEVAGSEAPSVGDAWALPPSDAIPVVAPPASGGETVVEPPSEGEAVPLQRSAPPPDVTDVPPFGDGAVPFGEVTEHDAVAAEELPLAPGRVIGPRSPLEGPGTAGPAAGSEAPLRLRPVGSSGSPAAAGVDDEPPPLRPLLEVSRAVDAPAQPAGPSNGSAGQGGAPAGLPLVEVPRAAADPGRGGASPAEPSGPPGGSPLPHSAAPEPAPDHPVPPARAATALDEIAPDELESEEVPPLGDGRSRLGLADRVSPGGPVGDVESELEGGSPGEPLLVLRTTGATSADREARPSGEPSPDGGHTSVAAPTTDAAAGEDDAPNDDAGVAESPTADGIVPTLGVREPFEAAPPPSDLLVTGQAAGTDPAAGSPVGAVVGAGALPLAGGGGGDRSGPSGHRSIQRAAAVGSSESVLRAGQPLGRTAPGGVRATGPGAVAPMVTRPAPVSSVAPPVLALARRPVGSSSGGTGRDGIPGGEAVVQLLHQASTAAIEAGVAQRAADGSLEFTAAAPPVDSGPPAATPPVSTAAPAPIEGGGAGPGAGAGPAAAGDLDELAHKLYDRIRWRLRNELRLDLERAGRGSGLLR